MDAEFGTLELDSQNRVIDVGEASRILREILSGLDYRNLDEVEEFRSQMTTAEFLARQIHDAVAEQVRSFFRGNLTITLHESPVAWASYTGKVE